MPQEMYSGFFAEFYDILHAGLTDVDSYLEFARRFGPDILELGCGTGRILIPLARAGFRITGIDCSDHMIARCQAKLSLEDESVRSRVNIVRQDVTGFELENRFNLIIAPCNMLNHFPDHKVLIAMLRCVKRHLRPQGVFILDNSIPDIPYMVDVNRVERIAVFEHPLTGTKLVHRFTATYDFVSQLEHTAVHLEEYDDTDKLLRKAAYSTTMTYHFPRELRAMLEAAGLEVFHEQGSLHEDCPIGPGSTEMVFFAR
ncbi:MAG: methyltransferase domain-containing protein [Firmicutes bacterium]|nr:methyltransferase domain-containing protein [Candidatus Fermentithermobacillaceae bacterium]